MKKVIAFVPMRKGSDRVKNKNSRNFAGISGGLCFIKISQLLKVRSISRIVISTNDNEIKEIARSFKSDRLIIDERSEELSSSQTSTDDLVNHVPKIITSGVVLWTHVTSPFIDERAYENIVNQYFCNLKTNDSLMSVTKVQKFFWNHKGPLNYNKLYEKWPRTQTLEPIFEVNSGAFVANIKIYKEFSDRIGNNPLLYTIDEREAFDVDWEFDFEIAELMWRKHGRL